MGGNRTRNLRLAKALLSLIELPPRSNGPRYWIRTNTYRSLTPVPLPIGLSGGMAAALGIEPTLSVLETAVLPLDDTAMVRAARFELATHPL